MLKRALRNILKVTIPFCGGGAILWWVYRDFDFSEAFSANTHIGWHWILLSLVFEILSHVLRGIRWRQTLRPLGATPGIHNCVMAIFLSYASNFIIPRLGEVLRCSVLTRYEGVPFSKSLGTVVTERMVDALILGGSIIAILFLQNDIFTRFFVQTDTDLSALSTQLLSFRFLAIAAGMVALLALAIYLLYRLSFFHKVKAMLQNVKEGIYSLRHVRNFPLFVFWSLAIWGCYFLQFYLAFFAFTGIESLSLTAALACFAAGSVGVIVPTPNGAGSWHFAVIAMMMLYGIAESQAALFALVVHGTQTFMLLLLGVYALIGFALIKRRTNGLKA